MATTKRFNTFGGVFTPSILSILGVIMYLRLPWIVGNAGLISVLGIILVAHIITISTGLSVSSIATNKKVGPGGSYFIISRSLGLPIGGTLGLALFVGFSFSVSLYLIGFAETVVAFFGLDNTIENIRLVGTISLVSIVIITYISTSLSIKTQYLIMAVIALSLLSIFLGSHDLSPGEPQLHAAKESLPWIALFAIFFPAVTGFQAGVSMSGDLKDPRRSIPLGIIASIVIGLIVYVVMAVFFAFTIDRESLITNPNVLFEVSWVPELVVAGIMGATLSSAMGSVLGAPRILQAISSDRITPSLFAKGYGASNEPRNALILTFLIAQAGILIGELNVIARIVSIFFIIIYGFINISYTAESWANSDFRPSFKIPRIVSIIGALACIIVMIQLDIIALIGSSIILTGIFLYLKNKELVLQSGDTWSSIWKSLVKTGLRRLMLSQKKPQNWSPNIILFSGGAKTRPHLIEMGTTLVGNFGIFTNFQLIEDPSGSIMLSQKDNLIENKSDTSQGIITRKHACTDIYEGVITISRIYGFSGFEPNTVLMGWTKNPGNVSKFSALIKNLKQLDFNQVYLNYNHDAGFGEYSKIDIWWEGKGKNLALCLTLLKYITASTNWRRAKVRILHINNYPELTESYYTLLNQVLDDQRIKAEVKIIKNNVEKLSKHEIIKSESYNSDLTILEIPGFSGKEMLNIYSEISSICESLKSCIILKASDYFEDISISKEFEKTTSLPKEVKELNEAPEPLASRVKVSEKELVANQIFNITKDVDAASDAFVNTSYHSSRLLYVNLAKELNSIAEKTTSTLEADLNIENDIERHKALLKCLNDFAFHAKNLLSTFSEKTIDKEKELIHEGINKYIENISSIINKLPHHINIKEGKKRRKKVRLNLLAKYLIYFKRLRFLQNYQKSLVQQSFFIVSGIRKIFNNIHELIEKARVENKSDAMTILRMERQKIFVNIKDFETTVNSYYLQATQDTYDSLATDLNKLVSIIENPKPSIFYKSYKKLLKNEAALIESIKNFPDLWHKSLKSFINKGFVDFLFLSLNSRINSKFLKYNNELEIAVQNDIVAPLRSLVVNAEKYLSLKKKKNKEIPNIEHSKLKAPSIESHYYKLFNEIFDVIAELPETMEISSLNIAEAKSFEQLKDAESYFLGIRKTAEFYISHELIDFIKNQSRNADASLSSSIITLKEVIKLANFNLQANKESIDSEEEAAEAKQVEILEDFISALKAEEQKIMNTVQAIESDFRHGLRKSFEPLSSAVIIQTSRSLKKKIIETENKKLSKRIKNVVHLSIGQVEKQFVKLLYTRSEGILWTEKQDSHDALPVDSYDKIHSLIEKISPKANVIKSLPFYYNNLFSGFSGIGEDFWAGMENEISLGEKGIRRFYNGSTGIIIITGKRSSGKSSLSKLIARKHFSSNNIAYIRAPKQASCDLNLFKSELAKAFNVAKDYFENTTIRDNTSSKKVAIINDLGLWWERKPGGDKVINYIKKLINLAGNNLLFIININSHVYKVIENQASLSSYTLVNI